MKKISKIFAMALIAEALVVAKQMAMLSKSITGMVMVLL